MGFEIVQSVWALARRQHGVVSRRQLLGLGLSPKMIAWRLRTGRLHRIHAGVYAVGRPQLGDHGRWMAAVLACGDGAALSHASAARLWEVGRWPEPAIEISVAGARAPRRPGIRVHRRFCLDPADLAVRAGVPVTAPIRTIVDLAALGDSAALDRTLADADKRGLVDAGTLDAELARFKGQPGSGRLRDLLRRDTFALTDSELEREFLRIVTRSGLPLPRTGALMLGFKLDFLWPDAGLVVETDGLRYHRTASQQARDRRRDQVLAAAGLTVLRFTHAQVHYDAPAVGRTLGAVHARLTRLVR